MKHKKIIKWLDPLNLARKISQNYQDDFIFLYSGLNQEIENSRSIIALEKQQEYIFNDLQEARNNFKNDDYYFGFVSYEYKNNIENFKKNNNSWINLEKIKFVNFSLIFIFDHKKNEVEINYDSEKTLNQILNFELKNVENKIKINNLSSNFSDEQYLSAINLIKENISLGNFYQTNLTRKFFGNINISKINEAFEIFFQLNILSPANFSAFINFNNQFIISASPELFIEVKDNKIISRPIKGTSPRNISKKLDEQNKNYLTSSEKEKAENLMIVDLVRNDISRVCEAKSVKVDKLFKVDSYKTLHHLSSEISGLKQQNKDIVDIFNATFPPGSMTGAPKIAAIKISDELENINRGVYSGSIGYFKGLNEALFNVVIRTLIIKDNKFEFQVGGAITYDSDAKKELEEIYVKAKAIMKVLNIKND